jgi:hypothetical protein
MKNAACSPIGFSPADFWPRFLARMKCSIPHRSTCYATEPEPKNRILTHAGTVILVIDVPNTYLACPEQPSAAQSGPIIPELQPLGDESDLALRHRL